MFWRSPTQQRYWTGVRFESFESGSLNSWDRVDGPPDGAAEWSSERGPWEPLPSAAIDGSYGLRGDGPKAGKGGIMIVLPPDMGGGYPRHNTYLDIGDTLKARVRFLDQASEFSIRTFSQSLDFDNSYIASVLFDQGRCQLVVDDGGNNTLLDRSSQLPETNEVHTIRIETNDTPSGYEIVYSIVDSSGHTVFSISGIDENETFDRGGLAIYGSRNIRMDIDSIEIEKSTDDELITDFEGENPFEGWTTVNEIETRTDRVFNGEQSGYIGTPAEGRPQARYDFSEDRHPDYLTYVFQETTNSTGGGVRIKNSTQSWEIGVATDNPEWYVDHRNILDYPEDNGGFNLVRDRQEAYDRWIRVEVFFDWSGDQDPNEYGDPTVDVKFTDLKDGTSGTYGPFPMKEGIGVQNVQFWNFNSNDELYWDTRQSIDMWFDSVYIN